MHRLVRGGCWEAEAIMTRYLYLVPGKGLLTPTFGVKNSGGFSQVPPRVS